MRGHGYRHDRANGKEESGEGRRDGGRHKGDHHRGGHRGGGHHGGSREGGYYPLAEPEGTHLLFIGSRSCFRHKGCQKLQLLREGKLSFLCLEEVDWITGTYLNAIEEAAGELIRDLEPKHLILFGGCQVELLSTDYPAITKRLSQLYSTDVQFHRGCHLTGFGEALQNEPAAPEQRRTEK